MSREEEKLNDNEQVALKIAEELSEGREFKCDSLDIYKGAMRMAAWKDQHTRKGLWDGNRVITWLKENIGEYYMTNEFEEYFDSMYEDLRKAMEEE